MSKRIFPSYECYFQRKISEKWTLLVDEMCFKTFYLPNFPGFRLLSGTTSYSIRMYIFSISISRNRAISTLLLHLLLFFIEYEWRRVETIEQSADVMKANFTSFALILVRFFPHYSFGAQCDFTILITFHLIAFAFCARACCCWCWLYAVLVIETDRATVCVHIFIEFLPPNWARQTECISFIMQLLRILDCFQSRFKFMAIHVRTHLWATMHTQ